jgi:hypothetical protein
MNTKVGTSFGLVLMLAIGVIAAMLALGTLSAPKAHAVVGTVSVTVSPNGARAVGQYTITTTANTNLDVGQRIFVSFNASTTVPASIDVSNVKLKASALTGSGVGNELRSAGAVTVSGNEVRITVPDMDTGTSGGSIGDDGIAADSTLTVTFLQAAGITNPNDATPATAYTLAMWTDTETTSVTSSSYTVAASVSLGATSGAQGAVIAVTAVGFDANCTTCSIFLTTGAVNIGSGSIDANGAFTGSFTVTSSTLPGGTVYVTDAVGNSVTSASSFSQLAGATPRATSASPGATVTVDLVDYTAAAVIATSSGTTVSGTAAANSPVASFTIPTGGASSTLTPYVFTVPVATASGTHLIVITESGAGTKSASFNLEVVGRVLTVTPNPAAIGQSITISGTGFSAGGEIAASALTTGDSGVINAGSAITIDSGGAWSFAGRVPTINSLADNSGTAITVSATDGTLTGSSSGFNRTARTFTLDPATASAGVAVGVSGTGMTVDTNEISTVTAQVTITVSSGSLIGTVIFPVNSDGTWSGTVTTPTTATVGTLTFTATDNADDLNADGDNNRVVTANLTVPAGTVTVTPASASTGSIVTVTGSNFPPTTTASVLTFGGASALPTGGITTDANGGFSVTTEVPAATTGGSLSPGAAIVSATVGSIAGTTTNFTVPNPTISISPSSATVEDTITITGTGFNALTAVTTLNIGTASALPSPAPRAGRAGAVVASVIVPLLNPGKYTVVMTNADGFTASATFTALAAAVVVEADTCAVSAVFEAPYAADQVERVFLFTNPTAEGEAGVWTFNDPREAFQEFNTYTTTTAGDIAWVKFTATSTFLGGTYFTGFNQVSLSC